MFNTFRHDGIVSKSLFSEPLKECIGFRDVLTFSEILVFTGNTDRLFLWLAMSLLETAICFSCFILRGINSLHLAHIIQLSARSKTQ